MSLVPNPKSSNYLRLSEKKTRDFHLNNTAQPMEKCQYFVLVKNSTNKCKQTDQVFLWYDHSFKYFLS